MLSKHLFYFAYVGAISPLLFILTARSATTFFLVVPLFLVHVAACLQLDLLVDKDCRDLERDDDDDEEDDEEEGPQYSHTEALRVLDICVADLQKKYPLAYSQKGGFRSLYVGETLAARAWPEGAPATYRSHRVLVMSVDQVRGNAVWVTSPASPDEDTDADEGDDEDGADGGETPPDASGSYPVSEIREVAQRASQEPTSGEPHGSH